MTVEKNCKQICHNYVRPHMALKGKTQAEVAGIKVNGDNNNTKCVKGSEISEALSMRSEMNREEIRTYLSQPLIARLATSNNGWPHVTSVWFEYDGENFWIPIQATTKKAAHVRKDKRVGLIVDTFVEPISKFNITQVVVKGEAELLKVSDQYGPDALQKQTMSVWHRYVGDEPEETLKKRLKIARYLIKIKPVKMYAIKDKW